MVQVEGLATGKAQGQRGHGNVGDCCLVRAETAGHDVGLGEQLDGGGREVHTAEW